MYFFVKNSRNTKVQLYSNNIFRVFGGALSSRKLFVEKYNLQYRITSVKLDCGFYDASSGNLKGHRNVGKNI